MEQLPASPDEREATLQAIAEALQTYAAQRATTEQVASPGVGFESEHSLHTKFLEVCKDFEYYGTNDAGEITLYYWLYPHYEDINAATFDGFIRNRIGEAAAKSKWGNELYNEDGSPKPGLIHEKEYSALSYARKVLAKSDNPLEQIKAVLIPAYIAAYYKPEGWDGESKPKKHKNEGVEDSLFRIAWNDLCQRSRIYQNITNNQRLYQMLLDKYLKTEEGLGDPEFVGIMHSPQNQALRDAQLSTEIEYKASQFIEAIQDPAFQAQTFRDELLEIVRLNERDQTPQTEDEPPLVETEWTILPSGTLEELEEGEGKGSETQQFVDPERMKWLAGLAIKWGDDAYMAVANLDKSGNYDYRVAILPQHKNGVLIEHAVAENPSSGNATYVFRAERGIENDGTQWLTWKDVLSDTKRSARTLGARKIVHNQFNEENVLEYLTRSADDLDKPGYKR